MADEKNGSAPTICLEDWLRRLILKLGGVAGEQRGLDIRGCLWEAFGNHQRVAQPLLIWAAATGYGSRVAQAAPGPMRAEYDSVLPILEGMGLDGNPAAIEIPAALPRRYAKHLLEWRLDSGLDDPRREWAAERLRKLRIIVGAGADDAQEIARDAGIDPDRFRAGLDGTARLTPEECEALMTSALDRHWGSRAGARSTAEG